MYRIFCPPGQQKVAAVERRPLVIVYAKNHLTVLRAFVSCMIYRAFQFFCLLVIVDFLFIYLFVL